MATTKEYKDFVLEQLDLLDSITCKAMMGELLDTNDVVEYCKNKVLDKNCNIYKQGKNWYCEIENIIITINSYSYTIITAHTIR